MSSYDYTFACEGVPGIPDAWGTLRVVRFRGSEAISAPYRYDLVLLDTTGMQSVANLIGKRATLRIATQSIPVFKTVHGIVVEAQEVAGLNEGRTIHLTLAPPWTRARHRQRCRIFLEKSLRQIVETVLQSDKLMQKANGRELAPDLGGFDFNPAQEQFAWRIADMQRLDDARVHPYVVQYNESDFDFVSRLLEGEGIAYHFEHGADAVLLVLADADAGRPRLTPQIVGAGVDGREIRGFFLVARLRPSSVTLGDYNWKQPDVDMTASAGSSGTDLFEQVYPGLYPDNSQQGAPLANVLLGRHQTEARYARGEGWLRVLSAGSIFELEHKSPRFEGEYLVTSLQVKGEQAGVLQTTAQGALEPFNAHFECARRGKGRAIAESGFRPARKTRRPKIIGSQTAIVTAEPGAAGAEINVGGPAGTDIGCVRLKFHWDTDAARLAKESSSCWVRVNEPF
ncbi:MAG TPA: contractile injection system protein, VgrG/Pvc8 family, partial [Polyangium sp.]|nr:contractile injection system protein, VgrG/Pvc8 family [Polyangium sp.]